MILYKMRYILPVKNPLGTRSHQRCSMQKDVLRNFTKFTGKHLCQSLFFKKSCSPKACNFIKKEILAQVLSCEFCEISKNTFFKEHLWRAASEFHPYYIIFIDSKILLPSYQKTKINGFNSLKRSCDNRIGNINLSTSFHLIT